MNPPDNVIPLHPRTDPPPPARLELLEYIRDQAQHHIDTLTRDTSRGTEKGTNRV